MFKQECKGRKIIRARKVLTFFKSFTLFIHSSTRPLYIFLLPLLESLSQRKAKIQSFFHSAFQCNNGKYDIMTSGTISTQWQKTIDWSFAKFIHIYINQVSYLFWTVYRAGEMDFKVEGLWNTEKECRPPWFFDKKNFWIIEALEWLKQ